MADHGPVFGQIYVQVSYAVMFLLSRVVLHEGMSQYLYVFFRQGVASIAITVIGLFFESGQSFQTTFRDVGKLSGLALIGITISQNLYYAGLSLTSTTLATTMNNINPASTFLIALAFRMEKLELSLWRGRAKLLGTVLSVGGATLMTIFTGSVIFGSQNSQPEGLGGSVDSGTVIGAILLAGGVCSWSVFLIYQAWITLDSSSYLTSTAVMCWMGTLQSGLVALIFVGTPSNWRLSWNLQFLTITYSGIFCSAIGLFVMMWCVKKKGPLFASVFSPLSNVLVAIIEPLVLHVPLRWGSLMGMTLVIGGLYCVLWGKESEQKAAHVKEIVGAGGATDSDALDPLLHCGRENQIKV